MLTKNHIQEIRELHTRTGRNSVGLFLVEWRKGIEECIASDFEIVEGFFREAIIPVVSEKVNFPFSIVSEKELERLSTLSSNRDGVLVVRMKENPTNIQSWIKDSRLTLILDGINDPGNLGTIIRIADWYGVTQIIASPDTVDCYNPKVIISTMGSFTRVSISYHDLEEYLWDIQNSKIYWAYLDGESIRTKKYISQWGYLVIWSESHGIRAHLEKYITDKITIPRIGLAESLNAGVATGIILERMLWK